MVPARLGCVSDNAFFSDRTGPAVPRVSEEISANAWRGLTALIQARIRDGALARAFPRYDCPDDSGNLTGTDEELFFNSLMAYIPQFHDVGLDPNRPPGTTIALDIVDFVAQHIDQPTRRDFHEYFGHAHFFFPQHHSPWNAPGETQFQKDVDLLFARNGIAFTLGGDMRVRRLGPPEARPLISDFKPRTGDPQLDAKLTDAMYRFQSRTPVDVQDALEKLWDAFERLKTLEPGTNKADSVTRLLDRADAGPFRDELESESRALTRIGNKFTIRHHERDKYNLMDNNARDYLFIRLAGLIGFVLRRTGRMAQ